MIFAPFAYKQTVAQQAAGIVYVPRYDQYSGSVFLAMPGTKFTDLGMANYYDDISGEINGVSSSLQVKPTGSGVTAQLYASSSVVNSGSFNWTGSGYSTSIFSAGDQNVGYYATSTFPFGTTTVANFVVETWFNRTGTFSNPPFNMFIFGEFGGDYILLDMNSSNFRYYIGGNQLSAANGNTSDTWYHVAYVKSGSARSIYLNGNRIANDTLATGMGTSPYWEVLGGNGNNDGVGKRVNDYRITVGSNRGYSGSAILVPAPLVRESNNYNQETNDWADATGITSTSILNAVDTFVSTCKTDGTWSKMKAIYPFITDSSNTTRAKLQFRYNLKDPSTYLGSYFSNTGTGSLSGWQNNGNDAFFFGITTANIGSTDFIMGMYTNSDAPAGDANDMGPYNIGADEYTYFSAGKNKSGANAQLVASTTGNKQIYNQTNAGPFTGLFGVAVNGSTGYFYRRTTQLGTLGSISANRANTYKIPLGAIVASDGIELIGPSSKTYQFGFAGNYLNSTEFGNLATAVNTLQGSLDTALATTRKAYT